jgi:peptidoglycan/xylan/chitin deacetylase (PgdA/CDA1 family)
VSGPFRPLVLCYHAVSDTWEHALATGAAVLERQLRAVLARRYRPARAADVLSGRGRLVHVTFDDAFTSVDVALPLLERLRMPATVFACTGFAGDGRPLDVSELAEDARAHPEELATMTFDDLRRLAERGVEIGAHTVNHAHLTQLGDGELDRELTDSRARLEDELGRPCRFLAYPYGEEDARVHSAARRAGYDAAFALPGRTRPLNPFALPRVGVYRKDGVARFVVKTSPLRHVYRRAL